MRIGLNCCAMETGHANVGNGHPGTYGSVTPSLFLLFVYENNLVDNRRNSCGVRIHFVGNTAEKSACRLRDAAVYYVALT